MSDDFARRVWLDCTDLFAHIRSTPSVNGIQRVEIQLIDAILNAKIPVRLCAFDFPTHQFKSISIDEFQTRIARLAEPPPARPQRWFATPHGRRRAAASFVPRWLRHRLDLDRKLGVKARPIRR